MRVTQQSDEVLNTIELYDARNSIPVSKRLSNAEKKGNDFHEQKHHGDDTAKYQLIDPKIPLFF